MKSNKPVAPNKRVGEEISENYQQKILKGIIRVLESFNVHTYKLNFPYEDTKAGEQF